MMKVFVLMLGMLATAEAHTTALRAARKAQDLPAEKESVIKPLRFDQKLLVCNAYPHKTPVAVTKNKGTKVLATKELGFNQCEYADTAVKAHDKLDFDLADLGVQGTFEVGALPDSDATLLLVLEKRDPKSSVVAFQSFAFPTASSDDGNAQVAVIDTYKGEARRMPHLKMQDHISGQKDKEVSKRVEELNFDRVYAVEEGDYDASVKDRLEDKEAEKRVEKSNSMLKLKKGKAYVVLRTGDDTEFPQSLVVFPPANSGASHTAMGLMVLGLGMLAHMIQ